MSSGSPNPDATTDQSTNADAETTAAAGQEQAAPPTPESTAPPVAVPPEPGVVTPPVGPASPAEPEEAPAPEKKEPLRPRVALNPVKDPGQLRAVGSVDAVEQPELVPAAGESPRPVPMMPTGPVEIPDVDDLDAEIAAQVEAALATGAQPQTSLPTVTDGEISAEGGLDETGLPVEGTRLSGTVQSIHEDNVFLDVALRISAVVPLRQFEDGKKPAVGDTVEVTVEGTDSDESLILTNLPSGARRIAGNWDDLAQGQTVECLVTKTNKGGLEVTVSNLRGFLPASQIDLAYVEDMEVYIGQKLRVQVTEVNKKKKNLVLSRRVLLQAERDAEAGTFWETLNVGDTHTGTVKTLKDYGAFINIGPVDGFLHIGEISWSRVSHPREVLSEGQTVEVKVIKIDKEKNRIGLGMRQLSQNPWLVATEKYAADRVVTGTVTRITEFGAFVQLEAGIEGLVHISELAWKRVRTVSDVLAVGQTHEFKVLEVDANRKRISLSLKQTLAKPEVPKSEVQEEAPAPRRAPRTDLRGGTGGGAGGGLFGNPSDFT
ncbi:MAG: 30S ribosomal protein S1 [Planctomycetaceae bacterium]